ncbi:hypothetical protein HRH25_05345 [Flavisolibacter sp. BT320]|nr:hypothetical protein [Flavisolibacter longurius]
MFTTSYYKIAGRWYLDAPTFIERGGNPDDLERIGAFHDFLEMVADGASSVAFQWDTQFFEGADRCDLVGTSGGNTGGYYRISQYRGEPLDMEIWLNTLIYIDREELPQSIYFKLLPVSESEGL